MYDLSHDEGHQEEGGSSSFFVDTVGITWTIKVCKDFGCIYLSWGVEAEVEAVLLPLLKNYMRVFVSCC